MLLTAVLAVFAVGTTVQASTGWEGNTFYLGGGQAGHLDNSSVTGFSTGTPEGGVFTTTIETVDVTAKTGTLNLWADYNDGAVVNTNAVIGELKVANDVTLNVSTNSWGNNRYFDTLTIGNLVIADNGSAALNITGPNHSVNLNGVSGSLSRLYSSSGNVTLGDGTNASIIKVERVEFSDRNGGDALNLSIESGCTLKVTGSTNTVDSNAVAQYKTNSFIISEWANSTNMNVRGTVLAENAAVLTGDSGATINIENGATLATKGLGQSNPGKTSTSTINLADGGTLILGDMGLNYNGRATVNVAGGTIGIAAGEVTIAESLNITGAATLETTQYTYGETTVAKGDTAGTVNITKDLTGNGSLAISGTGNVNLSKIDSSVSISAGEANISFGGTLSLGDAATFTAGSGTYTVGADISMFDVAPGGSIVDKNGAADNGFMQGSYLLISGGTVTNEFTVNYEGTDYTINNETRSFGNGGTSYNTWYVTQDSSTLSEVYAQSQAGGQVNADINLAAGTTLNADTALQSSVEMGGNATINISEGVSVAAASITTGGNTVTLDGKGTYNISAGNATKVAIAEGWSGTVELFGQSNASLDLSAYGQAGSTISLQSYTGYFLNSGNGTKTIAANLLLTNTNLAAVELTNGYSGCTYAFTGSVKGNGNFLVAKDLSGGKMTFEFSGDVSGWSGQMAITQGEHNVKFTGDSTVVNAQLISRVNGKANISFEHEKDVTVNSNFTNGANGIHLTVSNTGTTTFTSNQVAMSSLTLTEGTEAAFTGISSLSIKNLTLDANAILTIGNGTAVADGAAAPALTVSEKLELTGGATINGGLAITSTEYTAITLNGMDAAITINGDLTLPGTDISLSGDVLEALSGLTAGQQVDLFDVSGVFTLGDVEVSALAVGDKLLTDVFSVANMQWDEDIYLAYDGETVYAALMTPVSPDTPVDPTVPEPTTATLSLLALAALAARRRRK